MKKVLRTLLFLIPACLILVVGGMIGYRLWMDRQAEKVLEQRKTENSMVIDETKQYLTELAEAEDTEAIDQLVNETMSQVAVYEDETHPRVHAKMAEEQEGVSGPAVEPADANEETPDFEETDDLDAAYEDIDLEGDYGFEAMDPDLDVDPDGVEPDERDFEHKEVSSNKETAVPDEPFYAPLVWKVNQLVAKASTAPDEETSISTGETATAAEETAGDNAEPGAEAAAVAMGSGEENTSSNLAEGETPGDGIVPEQDLNEAEQEEAFEFTIMPLAERKEYRSSMETTEQIRERDQLTLSEHEIDFSDMKIVCLGDSITEAANLDSMEGYQDYSYPTRLGKALGAKEVVNLGIGGSSIGRYWADAFVERYREIPEDADLIIIMGGTNDGFCVSEEEFGSLEERDPRTFCGDLDELMSGLSDHYPDAHVIFMTPLPNILHDKLRAERDYLLPQYMFADAIIDLSVEYGFDVIDLYDSNLLDSHETEVIEAYVSDGVHPNIEGYEILGDHVAADVVRIYQAKEEEEKKQESYLEQGPYELNADDDPEGIAGDDAKESALTDVGDDSEEVALDGENGETEDPNARVDAEDGGSADLSDRELILYSGEDPDEEERRLQNALVDDVLHVGGFFRKREEREDVIYEVEDGESETQLSGTDR